MGAGKGVTKRISIKNKSNKTKFCSSCKEEKELNDFYFKKERGSYYSKCKECTNNDVRTKRYEEIRISKDGHKKCLTCEKPLKLGYSSDYCSSKCGLAAPASEWNEENALLLGLIASDGHLTKTHKIGFTSSNKKFVEYFRLLANNNNKISTKNMIVNNKKCKNYIITFNNYPLLNLMTSIGLSEAKSLTIPALKLPESKDDLFWLFLRGEIEGDGSILNDGISMVSASKIFLKWIKRELNNRGIECSLYKTNHNRKNPIYTIRIPAKYSNKLYLNMYRKIENKKIRNSNLSFKDIVHKQKYNKLQKLSRSICPDCKNNIGINAKYCSSCSPKHNRNCIKWPSVNEVSKLVDENGYVGAGKIIGCSDNAIRKFLIRNNSL